MTVSLYLSGGAANTNPELSIGGAQSSTLAYSPGTPSGLFGVINAAERLTGTTQYRLVYVVASSPYNGLKIYVKTETPLLTTTVGLGWAAAGINQTEPAIADEQDPPPGVTFEYPQSAASATAGGDFVGGDARGLWIEFIVQPGTPAITEQFGLSYSSSISAPVNSVLPVITGDLLEGSILTTSTGTWSGSPTSYAYQWQQSANGTNGWTNISSANGVTMSATQVGKYIRVQVTASNAAGAGTAAYSNATGVIVGIVPSNISAPLISGTATEGFVLFSTTGSWTGSPTSYIYSWQMSSNGVDWTTTGTNASMLALTTGHVGRLIRLNLNAANAAGSGTAVNSNVLGPVSTTVVTYSLDFSLATNSMYL